MQPHRMGGWERVSRAGSDEGTERGWGGGLQKKKVQSKKKDNADETEADVI